MWNVIGQPRAIELLRHAIEYDRLAHAYLFVGQSHVGKTTLAINLAQALNCEHGSQPCGQCRSCLRIAARKHADVQMIQRLSDAGVSEGIPKKDITLGQIKELQQDAALQPYEGRYRVFIIDGAEYLNDEAANCLLKTLEEPPPRVLFILLTVNQSRLLPTIVSRCQRVELFPLHASLIEQALSEHWQVDAGNAKVLSRLCRGGIGWAISAATDGTLMQERTRRLSELIGSATASLERRFTVAAKLATQFNKDRESVEESLRLWLDWWRDLVLVKEGCLQLVTNIDQEATLRQQSEEYSLAEIRDFIESLRSALRQLEQNANPRLVLEVLMLSIPNRDQERIQRISA